MVAGLVVVGFLFVRESVNTGRRVLAYLRLQRLADPPKEAVVQERPKPSDPDGLTEGTLTEYQRWVIIRSVESDGRLVTSIRKSLVEALLDFRPTDLIPARLDWDRLDQEAERRGCTVAEAVWDLGGSKEDAA